MALQLAPNLKVWGSQTAGADGDVVSAVLPGGVPVSFSGAEVKYPDYVQTQQKGVKIDRHFKTYPKNLKSGHDEVLQAAIVKLSLK